VSATTHLTLEQFHSLEAQSDGPRLEYWFGEAVSKAMPTWLHATLQWILIELFESAGYYAAGEVELRIDPRWQPKPDVVAATFLEEPYPTRPIEIVAEVLSPEDQPGRVLDKCREYERIGIQQIYIFDPGKRTAWIWGGWQQGLVTIDRLELTNGTVLLVSEIWRKLDQKMERR
jgi:Uma2 family endonuclease